MWILCAVNIPLNMAFAAPHNLWQVVFSVLLHLKYFLAPLWFFAWTMDDLEMCFLIYKCVNFLLIILFLADFHCGQRICSVLFHFEICWDLRCGPAFGQFCLNFPCRLEKFYFPLEFAYSFLVLSCGLFILVVSSFSFFFEILNCEV